MPDYITIGSWRVDFEKEKYPTESWRVTGLQSDIQSGCIYEFVITNTTSLTHEVLRALLSTIKIVALKRDPYAVKLNIH